MREKIKIETVGSPNISDMSEAEQKNLYITLLARLLEMRKEQLDKE